MPAGYDHRFPFDPRFPFLSVPDSSLNDVVDLQLQVREAGRTEHHLTLLRGVTSVHADPAVTIVDKNGFTIFSASASNSSYSVRTWSSERKIHTWRRTQGDGICQIVVNEPPSGSDFSGDIVLDPRTVSEAPPAVTKVVVGDQEIPSSLKLYLTHGYNTELTLSDVATQSPSIRRRAITLEAKPGDGLGRFPGCDDAVEVKTINGRRPDANGDFRLGGDGCYYYTLPGANALQLHNNCAPCWSCEEFVDVYEALKRVDAAYREISPVLEQSRRLHQDAVNRINEVKVCRDSNPLVVMAFALNASRVAVTFRYRNVTEVCQDEVELRFTWSEDVLAITDSGLATYADGSRPAVVLPTEVLTEKRVAWKNVPPGKSVRYRYTVLLLSGVSADITAEVTAGGSPIIEPVIESVEL